MSVTVKHYEVLEPQVPLCVRDQCSFYSNPFAWDERMDPAFVESFFAVPELHVTRRFLSAEEVSGEFRH